MYQVKKAEKGYITEFDLELFTKNAKETEMRRLFHKMLNEELFTYYFQPIVSAADGSIYAEISRHLLVRIRSCSWLTRKSACMK